MWMADTHGLFVWFFFFFLTLKGKKKTALEIIPFCIMPRIFLNSPEIKRIDL